MAYRPIRNAAELKARVLYGQTVEDRWLEFKAHYAIGDDAAADELARDIAQFANTEGGSLLIGIRQDRGANGRAVAHEGPGVSDVEGLKGWLEQAVRNHLVPSTLSKEVVPIEVNGKVVVAVNVPASIHLVALSHPEETRGIEYLYRTDFGKQRMNPGEVERHLMDGSRASRLAVRRVLDELERRGASPFPLRIVPPVALSIAEGHRSPIVSPKATHSLQAAREHEVQLMVDSRGTCINVPYSLIRDAWLTVEGHPAIALSVRIVVLQSGGAFLEPIG